MLIIDQQSLEFLLKNSSIWLRSLYVKGNILLAILITIFLNRSNSIIFFNILWNLEVRIKIHIKVMKRKCESLSHFLSKQEESSIWWNINGSFDTVILFIDTDKLDLVSIRTILLIVELSVKGNNKGIEQRNQILNQLFITRSILLGFLQVFDDFVNKVLPNLESILDFRALELQIGIHKQNFGGIKDLFISSTKINAP